MEKNFQILETLSASTIRMGLGVHGAIIGLSNRNSTSDCSSVYIQDALELPTVSRFAVPETLCRASGHEHLSFA